MKSNVEVLCYVGSYSNFVLPYVVRLQGIGLKTSRSDSNEGKRRSEENENKSDANCHEMSTNMRDRKITAFPLKSLYLPLGRMGRDPQRELLWYLLGYSAKTNHRRIFHDQLIFNFISFILGSLKGEAIFQPHPQNRILVPPRLRSSFQNFGRAPQSLT